MADEITTRRCIGSARYGIEPHDAPVEDFPRQPSQKDGLGRMCKIHWNAYTAGLARDAKARKAAAGDAEAPKTPTAEAVDSTVEAVEPSTSEVEGASEAEPPATGKGKRRRSAATLTAESQGDAG